MWIVDTKKEHLAVDEARKLRIPIIGILDTNCDPDEVDFAIPGNDDAIRSVSLLTRVLADAVAEGLMARSGGVQTRRRSRGRADARLGARTAGRLAGACPGRSERRSRRRRRTDPGEEQPEEAAELAEAAADAAVDVERQLDQPVNN